MNDEKKLKIKNIISRYRNKSSGDVSKEISFEGKNSSFTNSFINNNLNFDKKQELNNIKEESDLFNSNFYDKLKENQIEYIDTNNKQNQGLVMKIQTDINLDISKQNNFDNLYNLEEENFVHKIPKSTNQNQNLNKNPQKNFNSNNSLDEFNFDSENTCKDMLDQVKKVVEYNTNFINNYNNENTNNVGNINSTTSINKGLTPYMPKNKNSETSLYSNTNHIINNFENTKQINSNNPQYNPNKNNPITTSLNSLIKDNLSVKNDNNLNNSLINQNNFNNISNKGLNASPFSISKNINNLNAINAGYLNTIGAVNNTSFGNHPDNTNNFDNNVSNLINSVKNSKIDNIKVLHEYKLSLEGKIDNLKKIINKKISFNKFKHLNNDVLVNILKFFNTYDLTSFLFMNSYMKNKILSILFEYGKGICSEFEKKFSKYFLIKNSLILIVRQKKNRKFYTKLNLVIRFQISDTDLKNKTVILGYLCKFFCEKESFKNFFRFDVRKPGPLSYWVIREYTSFHQDELNKAYFQHIMNYCLNDISEINLNLFTDKGIIDINSFKWMNLNINKVPQFNFLEFSNEHNKLREVLDFDLSRFCEMEIMKNKWTDLIHMENYENIIKKLKSLFEPNFIIQKVLWDDVGYYLFKIFLIASQKGRLKSSNEIGIKISIKNIDEPLINEVKKNCLLFDGKNQIQIRIGDILVFYISKNK